MSVDYSIFCCPMEFKGVTGIRQENAINSWKYLSYPPSSISFISNDKGVEEKAQDMGCDYIPGMMENEFGTPLVSSIFELAQAHIPLSPLAYVNSDIVLIGFGDALNKCAKEFEIFLMISKRYDVDITYPIDFYKNWQFSVSNKVRVEGRMHAPGAVDFFAFPNGMYCSIPRFAIGRSAWDNYLVIWARKNNIPVVDSTELVYSIHQNLPESGPSGLISHNRMEERRRNRQFYDDYRDKFSGSVKDADYVIRDGRIVKKI